jgi:hypothetical protein
MSRIAEYVLGRQPPGGVPLNHSSSGHRINLRTIRIAVLLGVVIALNFTDLAYTLFAQSIGMLHEQNPIAAGFLTLNQGQTLICYKLLMVLAGTSILWKLRRHRMTVVGCWVLVSAYASLGVVWWMWTRQISQIFDMGTHLAQHVMR